MAELQIAELDFNTIKDNLKNFMQAQTEFTDYNFDGSGLSIFLDVLAYNTHYNAMLAHLMANEMFIDSAIKRTSVVSHAKALGYTPTSAKSATTLVNISVVPPTPQIGGTATILRNRSLTTTVDGTGFTFLVAESSSAPYDILQNRFYFEDVRIIEGTPVTDRFVVAADTVSGPFILLNKNIDTTTLRVTVYPDNISVVGVAYAVANSIVDISNTNKAFWIEETPSGKHQIVFGDDVLGAALSVGNVVLVEYVVCAGTTGANTAQTFSFVGSVDGFASVSAVAQDPAYNGSPLESIDSIRHNAPRYYSTRNRIVTKQDYISAITTNQLSSTNGISSIKGISVWGGEENIPPIFGKVFISVDLIDGFVLGETDKRRIINTVLKPTGMLSIRHEFVDPEHLYIGVSASVKYDIGRTTLTASEIGVTVEAAIVDYMLDTVSTLDRSFYYSKLLGYIDDTLPEIVGTQVALRLQKRRTPTLNTTTSITEHFTTALEPNSIFSTYFRTTIGDKEYLARIQDHPLASPPGTLGVIHLIDTETKTVLSSDYGTVNYATGVLAIPNILVTSYPGQATDLRIHAIPEDLNYNLSPETISVTATTTGATYPYPSKNIILRLDDSSPNSLSGLRRGLTVVVTPIKPR